jgi:hypothetical protein
MALLLLLAACSIKTLYNHLDYFIADYVSDMVTLDDVLEARVDTHSQTLLDWHRHTQLLAYADWFKQLQADVDQSLNRTQMRAHLDQLETFWNIVIDKAFDDAAELMPLLNSAQQRELFENISLKNAAFYRDYVAIDANTRREQFMERMQDALEPWIDDLTSTQQALVASTAGKLKPLAADRFKERQRWERGLVRIIQRKADHEHKTAMLRAYFKQFANNKVTRADSIKNFNIQLLADFLVQLFATLDLKQKDYLRSKLAEYEKIFRELAAQTKADAEP